MTTTAAPLAADLRVVPPAHISPDQFRALAAHLQAARAAFSPDAGDPFAELVASVRPFALATLAALIDQDEDAIAVLDEAQFQRRCIALTPRPDRGYSLSVGIAQDSADRDRRAYDSNRQGFRVGRA